MFGHLPVVPISNLHPFSPLSPLSRYTVSLRTGCQAALPIFALPQCTLVVPYASQSKPPTLTSAFSRCHCVDHHPSGWLPPAEIPFAYSFLFSFFCSPQLPWQHQYLPQSSRLAMWAHHHRRGPRDGYTQMTDRQQDSSRALIPLSSPYLASRYFRIPTAREVLLSTPESSSIKPRQPT